MKGTKTGSATPRNLSRSSLWTRITNNSKCNWVKMLSNKYFSSGKFWSANHLVWRVEINYDCIPVCHLTNALPLATNESPPLGHPAGRTKMHIIIQKNKFGVSFTSRATLIVATIATHFPFDLIKAALNVEITCRKVHNSGGTYYWIRRYTTNNLNEVWNVDLKLLFLQIRLDTMLSLSVAHTLT